MIRYLSAAILALALSTPAMASQCPTDIAKIDAALAANPGLDPSIRNAIKTLRDTGQRLHNSGKHADSVKTLDGAKQMLARLGVKVE